MAKPVIFTIDDEPQVLNAIERDLRRRFGSDYRILKAGSGMEALDALQQLKRRNSVVALFVVDQRMPGMTGIEFLTQARQIFPEARKVLLTAYADTEAAISSINTVGLNYYLLKPWDPPEQNLYPILDDLLEDWAASVQLPYEGIRVLGTLWSPSSHGVKDFLARNQIPYQWIDIELDKSGELLAQSINQEHENKLPVVIFPDGTNLVDPSPRELALKIGFQTEAKQPFYDLVIIGAGPAGLAAAVYAGSEGLRTLMIEKEATGGQAGTSSRIENYLGFPNGLSGADLARRATVQARRFGVEILTAQEAVRVRAEDPYRYITLSDGKEISAHAVLIATGVSIRVPDVTGFPRLTGAGIYFGAAYTEASCYRNQDVFVLGGANSAGQGAMFFSQYARSVTMLIRAASLDIGMSKYLVDQIEAAKNIRVMTRTELVEVQGSDRLETVVVNCHDPEELQVFPAAALFIFIGAVPHTEIVEGVVARDAAGFLITGPDLMVSGSRPKGWTIKRDPYILETSIPGIFAAGDVRHNSVKRVASAVGEGAHVVQLVHQYLRTV
jgi:thioredoxin reductase (NADPH)